MDKNLSLVARMLMLPARFANTRTRVRSQELGVRIFYLENAV
ncbi:hypothetical protein [Sphaerospermopsis sp. FACHB-1194]|nr:hypothetical protein [Sphaerospermopsis sp. FACHB-1194]